MTRSANLHDRIYEALANAAAEVESTGACSWRFVLENGATLPAVARLDGDMLELEAVLCRFDEVPVGETPCSPWDLAALGCELPHGVALARRRTGGDLILKSAHIVSGGRHAREAADTRDAVREACLALTAAAAHVHKPRAGGVAAQPAAMEPSCSPEWRESILTLCDEAGWPRRDEADGCVVVELDGITFRLHAADASSLGVTVEVARLREPTASSRAAIGLFLLSVNATVRGARSGVVLRDGDRPAMVVAESRVPWRGDATRLEHGLGACAFAVHASEREIPALAMVACARAFLAIQGVPRWGQEGNCDDIDAQSE